MATVTLRSLHAVRYLAGFTVGALLIGGIAYAAVPDSNGVIHGCVATRGGAVSVIDTSVTTTCPKGSSPLAWNQAGPSGPPGSPGSPGASGSPGATGPAGPGVESYVANGQQSDVPACASAIATCPQVAQLDLGAGHYVLSGSVTATAPASTDRFHVICDVLQSGVAKDEVALSLGGFAGSTPEAEMGPFSGSVDLSSPNTLAVRCGADLVRSPDVAVSLMATKVSDIHTASNSPSPTAPSGPSTVVFTIPPGNGSKAWNSSARPLVLHGGDTLRLTNNDTIGHELHSDIGCIPHEASALATGQSWDVAVGVGCSSGTPYMLYDHIFGQTTPFWIQIVSDWPTPSPSATSSSPGSTTVVFTIPPGTGSGAWNTSANPAVVHIGDTLRLTNGDSIAHRMHSDGACLPHEPTDLAPGASWDNVITASCSATTYTFYDHIFGQTATFYVQVLA